MDEKIQPCDNFYRFTCGNFSNNVDSQREKLANEYLSNMEDEIQKQLKSIVESTAEKDFKSFRLVQGFYNTCMNNGKKPSYLSTVLLINLY